MADLDPLIRVRKHVIEQKQKFLAELYRQAEELKGQRDALESQLAIESAKTKGMDAEFLKFFLPYSESVKARVEEIDEDRARLETRVTMAQDDMRAAFAELKKIEIIDERRTAEDRAAQDKKESNELDEIAINMFQRNGDEGT